MKNKIEEITFTEENLKAFQEIKDKILSNETTIRNIVDYLEKTMDEFEKLPENDCYNKFIEQLDYIAVIMASQIEGMKFYEKVLLNKKKASVEQIKMLKEMLDKYNSKQV